MNATTHHAHEQAESETAVFGFWVYLMTDIVLFASLFATYMVLRHNTAGGPPASELFDLPAVLKETMLLLTSSFTCGLAMLAAHKQQRNIVIFWFVVTLILGALFLNMELAEFRHLIAEGNSFRRSGFLSAFFTLISTHGLHIAAGIIWIIVMMVQLLQRGFTSVTMQRLTCLSLFWHFLDVVWIFIFSIVYLMGVAHL